MFAITELLQTLRDAWEAADLRRRLKAWWYVITHRDLVEDSAIERESEVARCPRPSS